MLSTAPRPRLKLIEKTKQENILRDVLGKRNMTDSYAREFQEYRTAQECDTCMAEMSCE